MLNLLINKNYFMFGYNSQNLFGCKSVSVFLMKDVIDILLEQPGANVYLKHSICSFLEINILLDSKVCLYR